MDEYLKKSVSEEIRDLTKTNEGLILLICIGTCLLMTATNIAEHNELINIDLKKIDKFLILWPSWIIALVALHIKLRYFFPQKTLLNEINYFTTIIGPTVFNLIDNFGLIRLQF